LKTGFPTFLIIPPFDIPSLAHGVASREEAASGKGEKDNPKEKEAQVPMHCDVLGVAFNSFSHKTSVVIPSLEYLLFENNFGSCKGTKYTSSGGIYSSERKSCKGKQKEGHAGFRIFGWLCTTRFR